MAKVLSAHSTFEIVIEVHQHPCRLCYSSEQPVTMANPLSYFCSTQISTEQSTTENKLTYSTEFLYAFTCMSGKACDITGPYTTVTNSLSPKTRASGSIRIIKARSISRGMPKYRLHSLIPVATLSCPVMLLFCSRRNWIKSVLQSLIF